MIFRFCLFNVTKRTTNCGTLCVIVLTWLLIRLIQLWTFLGHQLRSSKRERTHIANPSHRRSTNYTFFFFFFFFALTKREFRPCRLFTRFIIMRNVLCSRHSILCKQNFPSFAVILFTCFFFFVNGFRLKLLSLWFSTLKSRSHCAICDCDLILPSMDWVGDAVAVKNTWGLLYSSLDAIREITVAIAQCKKVLSLAYKTRLRQSISQ